MGSTYSRARRLPDLAAPRDYLGGKALRQDDRHRCSSIHGAAPTVDVKRHRRRDLSHHRGGFSSTLLIDEADTFLTNNEEISGESSIAVIVGSSGFVLRLVGDNHEPRQFSTWAAVAIALIGNLPETLQDRSILIRMRRRLPFEAIAQFRSGSDRTIVEILARKVSRHGPTTISKRIRAMDPAMPPTITNRDADNWRPLLAIADAVGGEWPARARAIAEAMTAKAEGDDQSLKTMLLEDIRFVFVAEGVDKLPSAQLVEALIAMKDRPWPELGRAAKPITQNKLAALLKDFGIRPCNVWSWARSR